MISEAALDPSPLRGRHSLGIVLMVPAARLGRELGGGWARSWWVGGLDGTPDADATFLFGLLTPGSEGLARRLSAPLGTVLTCCFDAMSHVKKVFTQNQLTAPSSS